LPARIQQCAADLWTPAYGVSAARHDEEHAVTSDGNAQHLGGIQGFKMTDRKHIVGRDLKEGTCVKTWFMSEGTNVVTIEPYRGPLAYLWPEGARIVGFNSRTPSGTVRMTVGNSDLLELA
jgi:hypothetical protein